jgi:ADP-heptose:LPS heptosyltransferase
MPDETSPLPPSIGVFDARIYHALNPGMARPAFPAEVARMPAQPRAILVVGLTAAGDVLHFLPVVSVLKRAYPRARIGWVVQDKARAIVQGRPDLDRVHVFERHRWQAGLLNPLRLPGTLAEIASVIREIRAEGYDLLVDPQGTVKSAMVNLVAGAKCRVGFASGFCRELNNLTTNLRVVLPTKRMHRVKKSVALLEAAGLDTTGHEARFIVPAEAQAQAESSLREAGLAAGKYAVIHPGTSEFGARKRWPLERFAQAADRLFTDFGLAPVFVLGPIEKAWKGELLSGVRKAPRIAIEPKSLAHLGGIIARAGLFLGCDSAPLHLASNLRVRAVGMFGPTDPILFAPYYHPAVVVVQGLKCPRCGAPHCNHQVPRMEALAVDDAMAGVALALSLTP